MSEPGNKGNNRFTLLGRRDVGTEPDEFFLPDLCEPQSILILVVVMELLVLILSLATDGMMNFSWTSFALTSLFVQWIVLFSAGMLCNLRPYMARLKDPFATAFCFILVMLGTLMFSLAAEWTMQDSWDNDSTGRIFTNLLISGLLTGIAFRYFYIQHQLRQKEQAALQSRIQALQARIRPHFLFNSMNIIASLISVDPDTAEEVVEDLSALFRASLEEADDQTVPLLQELSLCEKYIHIESLRLDDRLKVEWQMNLNPADYRIPLLTLQPLLENAIYHGIQPLPSGGTVLIEANVKKGQLIIRIENPVTENENVHSSGNRMAIENIRSRLLAIYGPDASLTAEKSSNRFVTIVKYPVTQSIQEHRQS